jgi:hypothetical protein
LSEGVGLQPSLILDVFKLLSKKKKSSISFRNSMALELYNAFYFRFSRVGVYSSKSEECLKEDVLTDIDHFYNLKDPLIPLKEAWKSSLRINQSCWTGKLLFETHWKSAKIPSLRELTAKLLFAKRKPFYKICDTTRCHRLEAGSRIFRVLMEYA